MRNIKIAEDLGVYALFRAWIVYCRSQKTGGGGGWGCCDLLRGPWLCTEPWLVYRVNPWVGYSVEGWGEDERD